MDLTYNYLSDLIKKGDNVVVAVSGGPDSMFLLHQLLRVRKNTIFNIIAAHVNHNVRVEESAQEKIRVEDYCKSNSINFEYLKIDKYSEENFHNYARKVRYNFFEDVVKKYGAQYLMTAHHGDDLIETVLMRIVRGASLFGYSGFQKMTKKDNYYLVRPLIELTKKEIEEYMDANKLWYAVDKSNFKDIYTRNRYRKYVLPQLKKEDKLVHLKFKQFSEKIYDVSNFIERYTEQTFDIVISDNRIDLLRLIEYDKIIIENIIYKYLLKIYKKSISLINSNHIKDIYNMILRKRNSTMDLPLNYQFIIDYDFCYIMKKQKTKSYNIEITKNTFLPNGKKIIIVNNSNLSNNNVIYLNSKDLVLPLYVRCRKEKDRINIKNMNNSKKIKDIFINEKIPKHMRDTYPIVVDSQDNVIWIPGIKKSQLDMINSQKYDIILEYV